VKDVFTFEYQISIQYNTKTYNAPYVTKMLFVGMFAFIYLCGFNFVSDKYALVSDVMVCFYIKTDMHMGGNYI